MTALPSGRAVLARGTAVIAVIGIVASWNVKSQAAFEHPSAAQTLSPSDALARVIARNPGLRSYEAAISIRFRETTFPWLATTLSGTAYYRSPDGFAVLFTDVPASMRSFPKAYQSMMNFGSWPRQYVISSGTPKDPRGRSDIALRLTPRDPNSDLRYGAVYIDPREWTIDEMDWTFAHMRCDITQTFTRVQSSVLLSSQHATISVPFARVGVTSDFLRYRTNVPVDANIFTRQQSS